MTTPESPDVLMRRTADRLDHLDRVASQSPWKRYGMTGVASPDGDIVGEWSHRCDCGESVSVLSGGGPDDANLIVALRPMVPLLVATLRDAADDVAAFGQHHADPVAARVEYAEREYPDEMAAARAVLGETEPTKAPASIEPGNWVVRDGEEIPGGLPAPRGRVQAVEGDRALVWWVMEAADWEPVASLRALGETKDVPQP